MCPPAYRRLIYGVIHNNTDEAAPCYSPDGKKIAYTVSKGKSGENLFTINSFGGGKTQLTNTRADESGPSWGSRP